MPTYEYACEACGNNWEAEQRITEPALKDCPKCGEARARRLISGGANFVLKGGGWYADLYSSAKPSSSKSESTGESKPAAETKSESKPAASESKPASKPASSSSSD